MRTKIIITLFVSLFVFYSCEKEVDFDEEPTAPKIIVNSICEAGKPVDVVLLETHPMYGEKGIFSRKINYVPIPDASVTLYVDGVETEELVYNEIEKVSEYANEIDHTDSTALEYESSYKGKTLVEAGKTYRIEIIHPDYETVTSETTIPALPQSVIVDPINIQRIATSESGWSKFRITFTDQAKEQNYYRAFVVQQYGKFISDYNPEEPDKNRMVIVSEERPYWNLKFDDPLLFPENEDANDVLFDAPKNKYNLFTDEFINGKTHELNFEGTSYAIGRELYEGEFYRLKVTLQAITREEYLYLKSITEYDYYQNIYFSEPIQVFSNINNGVGIFSGANSFTETYQYGEYPVEGVKYLYSKNGSVSYSVDE